MNVKEKQEIKHRPVQSGKTYIYFRQRLCPFVVGQVGSISWVRLQLVFIFLIFLSFRVRLKRKRNNVMRRVVLLTNQSWGYNLFSDASYGQTWMILNWWSNVKMYYNVYLWQSELSGCCTFLFVPLVTVAFCCGQVLQEGCLFPQNVNLFYIKS